MCVTDLRYQLTSNFRISGHTPGTSGRYVVEELLDLGQFETSKSQEN